MMLTSTTKGSVDIVPLRVNKGDIFLLHFADARLRATASYYMYCFKVFMLILHEIVFMNTNVC